MPKFSTDVLKTAARGRWVDLLSSLGGIDPSLLDSKHHACPKCPPGGGETNKDRFRAFDDVADVGGLLCNQCGTFPDGIGALQWLTGRDFPSTLQLLADRLGVKPEGRQKEVKPPDHALAWTDWNTALVAQFRGRKPGITEEAMLLCGARMAMHRSHAVVAWGAIGEALSLDEPVNYVAMSCLGQPLPTVKGEVVAKKVVGGKATGLLGKHGMERLLTPGLVEVCWKVEGVTDLNALQAAIPPEYRDRHVVVSNLFGCGEKPRWMAAVIAKAGKVYVLHDADRDGESGAVQWAREVAQIKKEGATVVRLPYDVAPSKGKDVRDWLLEGNSYGALMDLAGQGEQIVVKRNDDGDRSSNEQIDTAMERQMCRALQIEVLGETPDGKIKVFSLFHHKAVLISNVSRMTYAQLVQLCGPVAKEKVHKANEDIDGSYRFNDVLDAISLIAGYRQLEGGVERGAGVWLGQENGCETQTIILVNSRDAARWNGDKVLRRVQSPRVDGLLLDMSDHTPWYDLKTLGNYMKSASENPGFGEKSVEEAVSLFDRWRWKHQARDPKLMAGLVMASWMQSLWLFRPLVSLTGESHSGKSTLMTCLGGTDDDGHGIFGHLALSIARTSEAGMRQLIANSSRILMIDEFEKGREREEILKTLRTSTRGQQIARGSVGGKPCKFGLKHVAWVAATEAGAVAQADRNRYISFELLTAEKGKENQLRLPGYKELNSLGQRLLATALVYALEARELQQELEQVKHSIDPRIIACYSVPSAILAKACGLPSQGAVDLLGYLLETADRDVHSQSDTEDLLGDILGGQVPCGGSVGTVSVSQLLMTAYDQRVTNPYERRQHLERIGIAVVEPHGQGRKLFISPRSVRLTILRNDDQWKGVDLRTVLLRIPGANTGAAWVGGRTIRGILLPESNIPQTYEHQETLSY